MICINHYLILFLPLHPSMSVLSSSVPPFLSCLSLSFPHHSLPALIAFAEKWQWHGMPSWLQGLKTLTEKSYYTVAPLLKQKWHCLNPVYDACSLREARAAQNPTYAHNKQYETWSGFIKKNKKKQKTCCLCGFATSMQTVGMRQDIYVCVIKGGSFCHPHTIGNRVT